MKQAIATITGISSYQQGRFHGMAKLEKESPHDYEKRTWREKGHYTEDGYMFIPPMSFKKSIETAASFISMPIKGRGKATYTKHFLAGILVTEGMKLDKKKEEVDGLWVMGNSRGQRGKSGSRVPKCFPTVHTWGGNIIFHILDETITEDVFTIHLKEAGNFIGLGVFRPANGGYYGRFTVDKIVWSDVS